VHPLEIFSDIEDSTYVSAGGEGLDQYRVKVGGNRSDTLFPSPDRIPRDFLRFQVYVAIRARELPIVTKVRYEFTTPTGYSIQGERNLRSTTV
jgi:hypothetical protein